VASIQSKLRVSPLRAERSLARRRAMSDSSSHSSCGVLWPNNSAPVPFARGKNLEGIVIDLLEAGSKRGRAG
jgi:hypothetical protein